MDRFWAKVDMSGSCWLWTGFRDRHGYGRFGRHAQGHGRPLAHRVSYELHHGPIPEGMWVIHTCDVPGCVNPTHLRLGTPKENSADMVRKDRQSRGSRKSTAKLTEDQVLDIRTRYAAGGITQKELACEYSVSRTLIVHIVARKYWKHI